MAGLHFIANNRILNVSVYQEIVKMFSAIAFVKQIIVNLNEILWHEFLLQSLFKKENKAMHLPSRFPMDRFKRNYQLYR